jgi:hypothetical protein
MNNEKITVTARRTRFEPPTTNALASNPASPLVVQRFMQIVAGLDRKVDALATRLRQEAAVPAQPRAETPAEAETPEDTTALTETPKPKLRINRARLLSFFD